MAGHGANNVPLPPPSSPVSPHPLPSPAASFGEPPFPSNAGPVPAPAASRLRHSRPMAGPRAPEKSNLLRGAAGKRGHGDDAALSPSRGRQCPHTPVAPRSLGIRSHGARERQAPAVPSLPALSPSLPAFFSFFPPPPPPPNTSPRNARGGGSTISHCEGLSLYCSARQNTARPANKHPFICRPRRRGARGKRQRGTGPRQPLGPAKPPLSIDPRCRDGALCPRRQQGNG